MLLAYYSNHIWIDYLYPKKRFNLIYIVYSFFQKNNHIPLNKFIFHFKYRLKKYLNKIGIHKADRALMVPKMTYKEYSLFKNFFMAESVGRPSKKPVKSPADAWLFGVFVNECGGGSGGEDCVRNWRPF